MTASRFSGDKSKSNLESIKKDFTTESVCLWERQLVMFYGGQQRVTVCSNRPLPAGGARSQAIRMKLICQNSDRLCYRVQTSEEESVSNHSWLCYLPPFCNTELRCMAHKALDMCVWGYFVCYHFTHVHCVCWCLLRNTDQKHMLHFPHCRRWVMKAFKFEVQGCVSQDERGTV